jgi:hypothetical protein
VIGAVGENRESEAPVECTGTPMTGLVGLATVAGGLLLKYGLPAL